MHKISTTAIGGYFELELSKFEHYHKDAIKLNTGRNALELILITKKFKKIYIPYFTCEVILEPIKKLNIQYEFYHIDNNLEPVFDFTQIDINSGFLYTNYFGLKDDFIHRISIICNNLIIDNSQSFFSEPIAGVPTFYSCRKFFGVPDGAYLYLDNCSINSLERDISINRASHLLKRIEYGAEEGYGDFMLNDKELSGQPIKTMSYFTDDLLCSIDYKFVKNRRRENFLYLHEKLGNINKINLRNNTGSCVPMAYPLLLDNKNLKSEFIKNKIYIATYWPNVLEWCKKDDYEFLLANGLLNLPIDQRYNKDDLGKIINLVSAFIKKD